MKRNDVFSSVIGAMGLTISVQDLENYINIVLLIVSVINILYSLAFRIHNRIKYKEYDKISQDLTDAEEQIENLKGGNKDNGKN